MSSSPSNPEFNPLGKLVSLVALLAAALYFTGWIYRWKYFHFFNLQVTTLNLPLESFYLAAFQTLFGGFWATSKTIIFSAITPLAISLIFALIQKIQKFLKSKLSIKLNPAPNNIIQFFTSLTYEFIIVVIVLTSLFWLARWQAEDDAWQDAVNQTSSLPVVTVLMPKDAALGRSLEKPLENSSDFRIIGDQNLYKRLLGQELTDISKPDKPRVWRLLIDRENYFHIFPALPDKNSKLTIPIITIYKNDTNGARLTILNSSPTPP
jgi:hypothetical protein